MTTSFAHFTRLNWPASAAANAGGFLLAVLCAGQLAWLAASLGRGGPVRLGTGRLRGEWVLAAGAGARWGAVTLADWAVRLAG